MRQKNILAVMAAIVVSTVSCNALNALEVYLNKPEPAYKWEWLQDATMQTQGGGTAFVLNVTSLEWLDTSKAYGPQGNVWSHLVYVVVPANYTFQNIASAHFEMAGNENPNVIWNPESLSLIDKVSYHSQAVGVLVTQIPNCPLHFPINNTNPPGLYEDDLLAQSWNQFYKDPTHNPEWLLHLPMVKSAYQCLRAVEEWAEQQAQAKLDGWVVGGVSKRGWTAFDVAASRCEKCSKIVGVVPMVQVVPNLPAEVHRMWQAYHGFTFAFTPYLQVGFTTNIDSDMWKIATNAIDPITMIDRVKDIPKLVAVSADDQFMMFDWTNMWYDRFTGEKRLMILPNNDHGLQDIDLVLTQWGNLVRSLALGKTDTDRPTFTYTKNAEDGSLTVTISDPSQKPVQVLMWYAETVSTTMRDFRFQIVNPDLPGPCKPPLTQDPGSPELCRQPIKWDSVQVQEQDVGVYKAVPPQPKDGHWMGYYMSLQFPGDSDPGEEYFSKDFVVSTPGWTWPDTLPFEDCHGEDCKPNVV